MELNICHLYPDILNLYGDRGNILCMRKRLAWRGIDVNVDEVSLGQKLEASKYDLLFIGGGQDFEQEVLLPDLRGEKTEELKAAIEEVIEKLDGKDFVTGFTQFKVLDATRAEKNADGKYEVEISIPSITDDMENIQLLCYNAEKNEWSVVDPISVDKENKTLKVALDDLCYFSVIADAKADTTK